MTRRRVKGKKRFQGLVKVPIPANIRKYQSELNWVLTCFQESSFQSQAFLTNTILQSFTNEGLTADLWDHVEYHHRQTEA